MKEIKEETLEYLLANKIHNPLDFVVPKQRDKIWPVFGSREIPETRRRFNLLGRVVLKDGGCNTQTEYSVQKVTITIKDKNLLKYKCLFHVSIMSQGCHYFC